MGIQISRKAVTEQELAYQMRKHNCKISKRLYKIIELGYQNDYLSELEFQATIGWYHGLKNRQLKQSDEVFLIALDRISDLVCGLIQERHAERLRETQEAGQALPLSLAPPAPPPPPPEKLDMSPYLRILEAHRG